MNTFKKLNEFKYIVGDKIFICLIQGVYLPGIVNKREAIIFKLLKKYSIMLKDKSIEKNIDEELLIPWNKKTEQKSIKACEVLIERFTEIKKLIKL